MSEEQSPASRDERLVTLPMWIIEAVRAEVRLESHVWSDMARHVEASLAQGEQVLPCDVKLPPATVFCKGTKVSTLMLGIQQRLKFPAHAREFEKT
ncbi:hypothetical protein [Pseudomonas vancouverensis]|uniref:Uncharacterized protein n=1 Tax=Pseudomonas vancouverensis TaxID=95300 RepID=A0A1H2MUJ1_PSEVA|nr:hypothetical protein [Pseudomonas vancouverensis]KAB0489733.1 hypothetical protein F7R09_28880 [Pseudomonas vancouverensis]TDB67228.1 hypothetical protein EIY72_04050 [Pseudomonas vancouverensis]SDU96605.1 hypothetical protein SAMN05216558_1261 [Pseudomonas vancouverensis]